MKISTLFTLLGTLLQGVAGYDRMNPYSRFGFQQPMLNRFNIGGLSIPQQVLRGLFTAGTRASIGPSATRLTGSLPGATKSVSGQSTIQVKGLSPRVPGTNLRTTNIPGQSTVQVNGSSPTVPRTNLRPSTTRMAGVFARGTNVPGLGSVQVNASSPRRPSMPLMSSTTPLLRELARGTVVDPGQPTFKQGTSPRRPGAIRRPSRNRTSGTLTSGTKAIVGQPISGATAVSPADAVALQRQVKVQAKGLSPGRTSYFRGRMAPSFVSLPSGSFTPALQSPMGFLPRPIPLPPGASKPFPPTILPLPRSPPQVNPFNQVIAQIQALFQNSNLGLPPPMIFRLPPQMNFQSLLLPLLFDKLPDHQKKMGMSSFLQPTLTSAVPITSIVDAARDLDCVTMSEILNINYHIGCDDDLCPKGSKCRTVQGVGMCCPPSVTSQIILSHVSPV